MNYLSPVMGGPSDTDRKQASLSIALEYKKKNVVIFRY